MAITYYDLPLILSQVERLLNCLEAFYFTIKIGHVALCTTW